MSIKTTCPVCLQERRHATEAEARAQVMDMDRRLRSRRVVYQLEPDGLPKMGMREVKLDPKD